MTTVRIELQDDQAAALKAKAAAAGLTLAEWIQKLAEREAPNLSEQSKTDVQAGSVVDEMRRLRSRVKPDPEGWTTRDYVNYGRR